MDYLLILDQSRRRARLATPVADIELPAGWEEDDAILHYAARAIDDEVHRRVHDAARTTSIERMVLLAEHFARPNTSDGIFEALVEFVPQIIPSSAAALLVVAADGSLIPHGSACAVLPGSAVPPDSLSAFESAGLITRAAGIPGANTFAATLLPDGSPAECLACVAIGRRALLLVIERRKGRVFTPDEWYLLRSVARQADAALERTELRGPVAIFAQRRLRHERNAPSQ